MEKYCKHCKILFVACRNTDYCSNSCRCKAYYLLNKEDQKSKKLAKYYEQKKYNYEKLREVNRKASAKYKKKHAEKIKIRNNKYQAETKQSLKYHDERYFDGKRQKIISLYDGKCAMCDSKGNIVHHIDGSGHTDNINNDDNNLILMCRSCHAKYHYKGTLINEDIVRAHVRT